jgi:hypothetical protein
MNGRFLVSLATAAASVGAVAVPAYAARIVGNGGVGVVCTPPNAPSTVEVLDLYEGRRDWLMTFDLDPTVADPYAKVGHVLDRLAAVDPTRAALYKGWLATFKDDSLIYNDDQHFNLINDYGTPNLQSYCRTVQIAVQRTPENPNDRRYEIDGSYWDGHSGQGLDADNQAGLILHEIVYRDALRRGHTDSIAAHYLTALFASTLMSTMTPAELARRYRIYDMDAYRAQFSRVPGHATYLYFDAKARTFDEARALCRSVASSAGLVSMADFNYNFLAFADWKASVIGQELLAIPGGAEIWASPTSTIHFDADEVREHDAPGNTALAVCWRGS